MKISEPRRSPHSSGVSDDCKVCNSENREEIEAIYVGVEDMKLLAEISAIEEKELKRHMRALRLDEGRADNTEGITRRGPNRAIDRGIFDSLDAGQAIALLKQHDSQTGKVRDAIGGPQRPQVIILAGIPFVPALPFGTGETSEVIEGKILPSLPIGGIEELEVTGAPVAIPRRADEEP